MEAEDRMDRLAPRKMQHKIPAVRPAGEPKLFHKNGNNEMTNRHSMSV